MTTPARICLVSNHTFGLRALEGIMDSKAYKNGGIEISLLLTVYPSRRHSIVGFNDFSTIFRHYGISCLNINSIKDDGIRPVIDSCAPDYILVIGWSELVPSSILSIPMIKHHSPFRHATTHGCIGMHPTLLPTGRGRAPIPWTIIKNLRETGVSVFLLEEEADAGGIILQEKIQVDYTETATSLFYKCAELHYYLGKQLAPILASRELSWRLQDESQATIWPKRKPDDGLINFNETTENIQCLVRALTVPYPGAFFFYKDQKMILHKVKTHPKLNALPPGTVVAVTNNNRPYITTSNGTIECVDICATDELPLFVSGSTVNP